MIKNKFSRFIKPIAIMLDLLLIFGVVYYYSDQEYFNKTFLTYALGSWLLIAYYTSYYNVYRYTKAIKLIGLILGQFFIFTLSFFAYFTIFREGIIVNRQFETSVAIFSFLVLMKFLVYFFLKTYRIAGKNYRNVIVFGEREVAKNLAKLFKEKSDLGYRFFGYFSNSEKKSEQYLGKFKEGFAFAIENKIDEFYCETGTLNEKRLNKLREFATNNNIEIRLIPETKAIYSKKFVLEHYGTLPVLKQQKLPFEKLETHIIKRVFDVLFSIIICLTILSWLLPVLFFLVKIDSKGPLFFKQKRDGVNGKQFFCYKIRSMKVHEPTNKSATSKNDERITRIGRILRKTSIDEFPQFFNVLRGDMSVVGPRPHISEQTIKYKKQIDNYLVRNSVKPGITGLAQVNGYRGEVIEKADINNRVKFDIFYIENWSFLLDFKIIIETVFNIFKGDEKAY